MIDLKAETLVALRDVPRLLPRRRNGRSAHLSAIYRWIGRGVSGTVLESIRIGGVTYTSLEALQRFAEQLSRCASSTITHRSDTTKHNPKLTASRVALELGTQRERSTDSSRFERSVPRC